MLTSIPTKIVSGATVEFIKSLPSYPTSEWTLSYHFRGPASLDVSAILYPVDATKFLVTLIAKIAADPIAVGQYFYQSYATNIADPTNKQLVSNGRIKVLPDLSGTLTNYDGSTPNESLLVAIDAVLAKKALVGDQASYTIGQRTLTRIPLDQLLQWRNYYASLVEGERIQARIAAGLGPFENILTKFENPR